MRNVIAIILVSVLLTACGKPKIDSSSESSYKESLSKVNSDLSPEMQQDLSKALAKIAFKKFMTETDPGVDKIGAFRAAVDGKTAEELIAEAQK